MAKVEIKNIVGHKGVGDGYAENTLESFQRAAEMGLLHTEFDVRLTRDGIAVLANKDSLLTTARRDVNVSRTQYQELKNYNVAEYHKAANKPSPIPMLVEALHFVKEFSLHPQIELKEHRGNGVELADTVAGLVDEEYLNAAFEDRPLVTSFSPTCLEAFRKAAKNPYPTGLLIHSETTSDWHIAACQGEFDYIHVFSEHITPELATQVANAGYRLNAYKVMSATTAERILDQGVQRFTTDCPEIFINKKNGVRSPG